MSESDVVKDASSTRRKKRFVRIYKLATRFWVSFRSSVIAIGIIVIVLAFCKIIYDGVLREGFTIRAFSVPSEFEKAGYNGHATANLLIDKVNHMISVGNMYRTIKEVDEFNESGKDDQLKLEVGLFGFSTDILNNLFKGIWGSRSKIISGDILRSGKTLKFIIRIDGLPSKVLEKSVDESAIESSYEALIQDGAEYVMKESNPFLLGLYFLITSNNNAVEVFRYSIQKQPAQSAETYSWWADYAYSVDRDSSAAKALIKKSLAIDPNTSNAYRILSLMQEDGSKKEEYLKRALELNPTSVVAWINLGQHYSHDLQSEKKAIECYEKVYDLDPLNDNNLASWCELYIQMGDLQKAYEISEKLKYSLQFECTRLSILVHVLNNDTAAASRCLLKGGHDQRTIIEDLNYYAYNLEKRKKYELGFRLVEYALRLDSISEVSAYPYSTRAELFGLVNNDEQFYYNIEMAFKRGFKLPPVWKDVDAYKKFANEGRFQFLIKKYKSLEE